MSFEYSSSAIFISLNLRETQWDTWSKYQRIPRPRSMHSYIIRDCTLLCKSSYAISSRLSRRIDGKSFVHRAIATMFDDVDSGMLIYKNEVPTDELPYSMMNSMSILHVESNMNTFVINNSTQTVTTGSNDRQNDVMLYRWLGYTAWHWKPTILLGNWYSVYEGVQEFRRITLKIDHPESVAYREPEHCHQLNRASMWIMNRVIICPSTVKPPRDDEKLRKNGLRSDVM